jgi:streptomycin 6-kinase
VGIIGGDDPQGHHIRRVGCCWLLLIGACWLVTRIKVMLTVPSRLAAACLKTPQRAAWLARLPEMLAEVERRWSLTLHVPFDNAEVSCAWVSPVMLADGARAVLKLGMPHMEGQHEIEGLRFWDGDPTVRLLQADDDLGAMLLERCEPGTALRTLPESEQDLVLAGLLRRLWRRPAESHAFRPLSLMTAH